MSKGKSKVRPSVGQRRRLAAARRLGLRSELEKQALDDMNACSLERYGLGIGVLVQEEARWQREAESHAKARGELPRWRWRRRRAVAKMERDARDRHAEWARRFRAVALDVAQRAPDGPDAPDADVARSAGQR